MNLCDRGDGPVAHALSGFRVNAQLAIGSWSSGHEGRKLERDWQNETEVVIGVLANEVDAARRAKNAETFSRAVQLPELFELI
jgi:hypothetical protein